MESNRKLIAAFAVIISSTLGARTAGAEAVATIAPTADLAHRLMSAQNAERELVGVQPLAWDSSLAAAASEYAAELAATGKWEHSSPDRRLNQGENLWMGTRSAFTPEQMVADWLTERRIFRGGTFPDIVTRGSWHDVGHYTQIIWTDTLRVGCAVRSSKNFDYLVCRYSSPGNVMGERVGPTTVASR
jgi:hypothetical protein